MIAHIAIRKTQIDNGWVHAHGWVLGSATGADLATSRAQAIRRACIEATSAGATGIALPAVRDYPAALGLHPSTDAPPSPIRLYGQDDPAAVAVAQRAASVEIMRECIRRRGAPDLLGEASRVIDCLGGPETVADVLGCDAAQVCRWARAGKLPAVRVEALRRELEAMA